MLITQTSEIISLMPTARWDRPEQLFGYLDEEERVNLEPLLGPSLYAFLLKEYDRLIENHLDITSATIRPTGQSHLGPQHVYADVTQRIDAIQSGAYDGAYDGVREAAFEVTESDMASIRLIRICQQIEFYYMIAHKSGLLTVSFNEGGGMNIVSADGYDGADEKRMDRVVKDAVMSAGRSVDSLLLFLEDDAKGKKLFAEKWKEADAYYLHRDLLFSTARELNEYLPIDGDRYIYVELVRDIRYAQNTYIKPKVGGKLLRGILAHLGGKSAECGDTDAEVMDETVALLRTALAFYVESRRDEVRGKKIARRDSLIDAQQALAAASGYIAEHIDSYGEMADESPQAKEKAAEEARARAEATDAELAERRREQERCEARRRSTAQIYAGFPAAPRFVTEQTKK